MDQYDLASENWDSNRAADVVLPSPDRVDKVPKRWNISEDSPRGSGSAKKATAAAAGVSRLAMMTMNDEDAMQIEAAEKAGCVKRPARKRKCTAASDL